MDYPFLLGVVVLALVLTVWCSVIINKYNTTDWGKGWLNFLDGLNRLFCFKYHRLQQHTLPIPAAGRAIVVANHISGLDPLLLIAASTRPLRFIIAREEYQRFGLQWLFRAVGCIPVDRGGRADSAMREALRALENEEVLALFPHGKIHLDHEPPRKLKAGVARLASRTGSDIYPVRITGVKGQGKIIRGVIFRSHARLAFGEKFLLDPEQPNDLEDLSKILRGESL